MTYRRVATDFDQRIHEQMHRKTDLVAAEVEEEGVDRLAFFRPPESPAVPSLFSPVWLHLIPPFPTQTGLLTLNLGLC